MIEGKLITHFAPNSTQVWGQAIFPEMSFAFRDRDLKTCEIYLLVNGGEEKIGESTSKKLGFLGMNTLEMLTFNLNDQSIGVETGFVSKFIHHNGERIRFLMDLNVEDPEPPSEDDDENDARKSRQPREWRSFQLGESRLEHHDYENHFRIFSPNEDEGLKIGFIAFRFWAAQLNHDNS